MLKLIGFLALLAVVVVWGLEPMVRERLPDLMPAGDRQARCLEAVATSAPVIDETLSMRDRTLVDLTLRFNVRNGASHPCLVRYTFTRRTATSSREDGGNESIPPEATVEVSRFLGSFSQGDARRGEVPVIEDFRAAGDFERQSSGSRF